MTFEIIIQIILFGVALSADAFAVSVTDGLTYTDINKKRILFIAIVFGVMQGLMPLIGYWLVEAAEVIVGEASAGNTGQIMALVVTWIAFGLLIFIGGKMLIEGILETKKTPEEKQPKTFSAREVLIFGVATAIDALGTGVALHSGTLSDNYSIFLHVSIIMVITFGLSLVGLFLGKQVEKLFKGKYEITQIIGGVILLLLGVWIVLSHYLGI